MAEFKPDLASFASLKDKVIVLSGGATGIGASTTALLTTHGAHVVLGDINEPAAKSLVSSINQTTTSSSPSPSPSDDANATGTATFVRCDVTNYNDIHTLFRTALDQHGRVDHAVSCAGILETGKWFDPTLTVDTIGDAGPGPSAVIDINVMGTANFSRVAVPFLKHGMENGENKSLTLLSSVNAFRESPGLYMYQTSKHAIQGLMRAMRKPIHGTSGVRVNCVCPGMTESEMTKGGIIEIFKEKNLYWQPASAVAEIVLGLQTRADVNGKAIYVEGGDGWEFEDSFYREQPRWLGEEATRRMRVNAEAVNKGALIKK